MVQRSKKLDIRRECGIISEKRRNGSKRNKY